MKKEKKLVAQIRYHKALYYQGNPELADEEYDKIEDELKKINPKNPILFAIGTKTVITSKLMHKRKMLSLGKTYDVDELKEWIGNKEVISMHKIDGVSCSLVYEDGDLLLGKTRGDGSFGEEITESVRWMESIPSKITKSDRPIEIRGEIYCTDDNFSKLAKEMERLGLSRPTSPRNIVAGLISRKENIQLARHLSFMAFDIIGIDEEIEKEKDKFEAMENEGFIIPTISVHQNLSLIDSAIQELKIFSEEGEYQVDGLVFTYNDIKLQEELGETSHHPKYKQAFKFKGDVKKAILKEISWQVSRNGILTPVAEIEPIELSGAQISRVTLHNLGIVETNNLKIGDEIELIRSGEVIPKFLRVTRPASGLAAYPNECPGCKTKLRKEDIRLICDNKNCQERKRESLLYYVQKIGIENLSSKRLDQMIKYGMLENAPDLYNLSVEKLIILDSFQEKLAQKICNSIELSKRVTLKVFLTALGIAGGASNKIEKIIIDGGYNTLDKILSLNIEQMLQIPSFAEKSSNEFLASLAEKKESIKALLKKGVFVEPFVEQRTSELSGKKFCITGALSEKRSIIEEKIKKAGGEIIGSVSKKTDYLLTNEVDGGSSKFKKAQSLGIKIVNEKELESIILT